MSKKAAPNPQAVLDLHGMTLEQAFESLFAFLDGCQSRGLRRVLVITGKGRNSKDMENSLYVQVPRWLSLSPAASAVSSHAPADSGRYGEGRCGAVAVTLRRRASGPPSS